MAHRELGEAVAVDQHDALRDLLDEGERVAREGGPDKPSSITIAGRSDFRLTSPPVAFAATRRGRISDWKSGTATYPASARVTAAFTTAGLALPPIARIACPTKKPNSLSFPAR